MLKQNRIKLNNFLQSIQYSKGIYYTFYFGIMMMLLFSAITKIFNPEPFIETVKNIYNFNEEIILAFATIFPMFELLLAVLLAFRVKEKHTLIVVMLLFLFFFLFAVYGSFFLKLNSDCGCFGGAIKSYFGWGIVIRNIFFLCFSVITFYMNSKKKSDTETAPIKSIELNL